MTERSTPGTQRTTCPYLSSRAGELPVCLANTDMPVQLTPVTQSRLCTKLRHLSCPSFARGSPDAKRAAAERWRRLDSQRVIPPSSNIQTPLNSAVSHTVTLTQSVVVPDTRTESDTGHHLRLLASPAPAGIPAKQQDQPLPPATAEPEPTFVPAPQEPPDHAAPTLEPRPSDDGHRELVATAEPEPTFVPAPQEPPDVVRLEPVEATLTADEPPSPVPQRPDTDYVKLLALPLPSPSTHEETAEGGPPQRAAVSELCVMTLPVHVTISVLGRHDDPPIHRFVQRTQMSIEREIHRLSLEGWTPDEPTEFLWLYANNRLECVYTPGLLPRYRVRNVTLRFKRMAS